MTDERPSSEERLPTCDQRLKVADRLQPRSRQRVVRWRNNGLASERVSENQAATGITFERTNSACQTPYNGTCISIITFQQSSCGFAGYFTNQVDPVTGYYTGELFIRVRPDWASYTASGQRRTLLHELQHYMGLDNYSSAGSCGTSNAVMRDDFNCAGAVSLTTLTINDYLPVLKTSYGSASRNACGW